MPDPSKPFVVETDTSKFASGGILQQQDMNRDWHPCSYISKSFRETKQNYDSSQWVMLDFFFLEEMIAGLVKGVKTGGRKEYDTVVELYGKPKTPTKKIVAMSVHLDLSWWMTKYWHVYCKARPWVHHKILHCCKRLWNSYPTKHGTRMSHISSP